MPEEIETTPPDTTGEASNDFYAGVMFLVTGLLALIYGRDLEIGVARDMGPGYFPIVIAAGLALFGGACLWRGRAGARHLPAMAARPLGVVTLSVIVFALSVERLGLFITSLLLCTIVAFAARQQRFGEAAVVTFVLSIFSTLLFGYALGLSMPLWPP